MLKISKNHKSLISEEQKLFDELKSKPRFTEQIINLKNYTLIIPDPVSVAYQIKDIFIEQIYSYRSKSETPVIYDCGANIGLSILFFKEIYPNCKIKAFEADKNIFKYLEKNITKNKIQNIELFNNAVWVNNETLFFNSEGADGGSLVGNNNSIEKQEVQGIRLKDMLLNEENVVDFLKIDIEGAETAVIFDCNEALSKVNNICIEYHSFLNTPQELDKILSVLSRNGFRYHIETINHKNQPFLNKNNWNNMDLQLEIFGYKD